MTKPPFAVLFDLDGVLMDTEPAHDLAFDALSRCFGFTKAEMRAAGQRGGSLRDRYLTLQALRPFAADFQTFCDTVLDTVFEQLTATHTGTDPQLVALLHDLRRHGIPVAIGTSSLRRSTVRKLAILELSNEFDAIVTAEDAERHKPWPDIYLEAARRVGMDPKTCVVIEDAAGGIQAAKTAGMKVVGYTKHVAEPAVLAKADLLVDRFDQLSYKELLHIVTGKH